MTKDPGKYRMHTLCKPVALEKFREQEFNEQLKICNIAFRSQVGLCHVPDGLVRRRATPFPPSPPPRILVNFHPNGSIIIPILIFAILETVEQIFFVYSTNTVTEIRLKTGPSDLQFNHQTKFVKTKQTNRQFWCLFH